MKTLRPHDGTAPPLGGPCIVSLYRKTIHFIAYLMAIMPTDISRQGDFMPFANALPFAAAGLDLIGSVMNFNSVQDTNRMNQANLERAWARDDNALQRRLADARAAGFSPNAALSGSSGNTNPMNLTPPTVDFSGASQNLANGPTINVNRQLADKQSNLVQTQLEAQQAELEHKKDMYIKELARSDLEAAEIIGRLLDAEIITKDDIPDTFKSIKAEKDQNLGRLRQIEKDKVSATNAATKVARDRLQADKDEREWQHNADTRTHTTTNKISYSVGGVGYELTVSDSTTSQQIAVEAGVDAKAKPSYSSSSKSFQSNPQIYDVDAWGNNKRDLYYVGKSTRKGMPCYGYSNGHQYYVAVPAENGIQYYIIDKRDISPVHQNYEDASSKFKDYADDYSEFLKKFYGDKK